MGNGALATGPKLPRPSSTLPDPEIRRGAMTSTVIGGRADARSILPDRQKLTPS